MKDKFRSKSLMPGSVKRVKKNSAVPGTLLNNTGVAIVDDAAVVPLVFSSRPAVVPAVKLEKIITTAPSFAASTDGFLTSLNDLPVELLEEIIFCAGSIAQATKVRQ